MNHVHVAAAILKKDGRILICKRPADKKMGGLWEFPGGKLEPFETPEAALIREMREELEADIEIEGLFRRLETDTVCLHFFDCTLKSDHLRQLEHPEIAFVLPKDLATYHFCPPDAPIVAELMRKPRFANYIWDLDGTLTDTYPGMTKGMQQALHDFGIEADMDELANLMKRSVRTAMQRYPAPEADLRAAYTLYEQALNQTAQPVPYAHEALQKIQAFGGMNHIFTHRDKLTMPLLNRLFPDIVFGQIITPKSGFPLKPAPDALNAICERGGFKKESAMMVGDRDIDIICASNAGMAGCLLDPGGFYKDFETDFRVDNLKHFCERFI
jgi:haloacid dehalogenase superfamily, subfamily IA, variant 1 with third motif having Dx(3-4)D or Dx(3-4)E